MQARDTNSATMCSGAFAGALVKYHDAEQKWRRLPEDEPGCDGPETAAWKEYYAAYEAAMNVPVVTPGDLVAKVALFQAHQDKRHSSYEDDVSAAIRRNIESLCVDVKATVAALERNASPKATMPDGGTYQDEAGEWRARLWSWGDTLDMSLNWLGEVSQTLELVESRAGDDGHHGPVALAHDRLLDAIGDLRKLEKEIALFHSSDDAPVVESEKQESEVPIVGSMGHDQDKVSIPPEILAHILFRKGLVQQTELFPAALARYRSASALRDRHAGRYETEEASAAIDLENKWYREAMFTEAATVADVLAKLEIFEEYRCDDGGSMDRDIEAEIGAAFADVRNVLKASSLEVSPAFAARVRAWRELRDAYNAAQGGDNPSDAVMDPLHVAKMDAYNALLDEPVQTFGDVLAMARTIKEEDHLGTESASYYEPAFDALIAAVESLASEGSEQ